MERNVKVLIVVCVVLIAGLSLTTGYIIFPLLNHQTTNITNNSTNINTSVVGNATNPSTNDTNTESSQVKHKISTQQAMHIVDNYLSGTGCYAISAKMVDSQVYGVLTYDGINHKQMGYKYVNATTGAMIS